MKVLSSRPRAAQVVQPVVHAQLRTPGCSCKSWACSDSSTAVTPTPVRPKTIRYSSIAVYVQYTEGHLVQDFGLRRISWPGMAAKLARELSSFSSARPTYPTCMESPASAAESGDSEKVSWRDVCALSLSEIYNSTLLPPAVLPLRARVRLNHSSFSIRTSVE